MTHFIVANSTMNGYARFRVKRVSSEQMNFFGIGLPELLIISLILLLLFGAAKLPALGRSIGQFGKEVKKGFDDEPDKKSAKKVSSSKKK